MSEQVVFDVRQRAAEQGVSYLPGTVPGFVRVLAEGVCPHVSHQTPEETLQYVWSICLKFGDIPKRYECVKLVDAQKLFESGSLPKAISVVSEATASQVSRKVPVVDFRAQTGDFIRMNKSPREAIEHDEMQGVTPN